MSASWCLQIWYEGGSFMADGCEVANNDDDLSDVFTYMGYACANAGTDRSIFAQSGSSIRWLPGNTLKFYDCQSLEALGEARLTAIENCSDKAAFEVRLHTLCKWVRQSITDA